MKWVTLWIVLWAAQIDDGWHQYCARNWLREVPVNVCLPDPNDPNVIVDHPVRVRINYRVLISRDAPEIQQVLRDYYEQTGTYRSGGIAWNDEGWCYGGAFVTPENTTGMRRCDPNES